MDVLSELRGDLGARLDGKRTPFAETAACGRIDGDWSIAHHGPA
jgi:hypothetical protein